ncbi:MAG: GTPase HflX, partial [Bryobacteraceae bacterium]
MGDLAILVRVEFTRPARRPPVPAPLSEPDNPLDELAALAASAGAQVAGRMTQSRPAPEASTLIGSGKLEDLGAQASAEAADLVIFDHDLTPTQLRNLERALPCRVVDRTQLILDIFARRAHTREGQLQVELAQLTYLLPRLSGRGAEMSRLGGGIGTRGPGETQLETDRRRIHRRIQKIHEQLEAVRASRGVQRRQRQDVPLRTVALIGYTNAGKSTLFNRLTGAGVEADARLFATLDPTVRQITLPSRRRVLVSDTVGFIRDLPASLVKAFRATLEEVREASLLLHVVDATSPAAAEKVRQVG